MLNETIAAGLNNPDCAFFVGNFMGNFLAMRWLFFLAVCYFMFKIIDKLAFEPIVEWMKSKIKKKRIKR